MLGQFVIGSLGNLYGIARDLPTYQFWEWAVPPRGHPILNSRRLSTLRITAGRLQR